MAEIRSIKDVFRDPLIIALVLVAITGLLVAVIANYRTSQEGRGSQDARATNQPSTQSLPADTKPQSTQSDSQAPAITEPSTQAPATGETKAP
jgi:cytoskeletal protein RodZ